MESVQTVTRSVSEIQSLLNSALHKMSQAPAVPETQNDSLRAVLVALQSIDQRLAALEEHLTTPLIH